MASSIIGIAGSGLNAQGAPLVISHTGNAPAEGAHRQPASTHAAQDAMADAARRAYSRFLDDCALQAQTQSAHLDAYGAQIRQIESLLSAPAHGLSPALQSFFSGIRDVAAQPASVPLRQQALDLTQALVASFWSLAERLDEMRQTLDRQVSDVVAQINALLEDLARSNARIAAASQQGSDDREPRDAIVTRLNTLVRVSAVRQADGDVNLFTATGLSLLLGAQAFPLVVVGSAEQGQPHGVFHVSGDGRTLLEPGGLQGGQLGGLLAFREETLNAVQNQLGRIAVALAQTFNDQHRLGMDLQGDPGQEFFRIPLVAVLGAPENTGTAVIAAERGEIGALSASDYRLRLNAGTWTLTRLSDNTRTSFTGLPHTVDGITLRLASGAAAGGDAFLIQPTRNGARDIAVLISDPARIAAAAHDDGNVGIVYDSRASGIYENRNGGIYDNRNAQVLTALQMRAGIAHGSATYQSACDRIAHEIADRAHAIEVQSRAQDALVKQARATQRSLAEVNLDEEAASLFRHQQAYQASGRALQAAAHLFDSLLEIGE